MRVADLHESNWAGACYFTGGGSLLLSQLLCEPGASKTILNAAVPYSYESLANLLGHEPEQACAETTARNLAMKAYVDARKIGTGEDLFGLAITASLRTDRPKRGALRAYIALQTNVSSQVTKIEFSDTQTRAQQETVLAEIAFEKLCLGLGLGSDLQMDSRTKTATGQDISHQTLFDTEPAVLGARSRAYLPGAFNPLHAGHRRMRDLAQEILHCEVQYELSINNVDKLPLDYFELNQRLSQFRQGEFALTNLPYFYQKAKHLGVSSSVSFVVGIDTFARIIQPKFYETSAHMDEVLNYFVTTNTNFLVFGRTVSNKFKTLDDLQIPELLLPLCCQVEPSRFQCDLASSTLRSDA